MSEFSHRAVSAVIYYFAFAIGVPTIAGLAVLASSPFPGNWGLLAAIVAALIGFGLGISLFQKLRRWRVDGFFRIHFPTYRGMRIPAFGMIGGRSGEYEFSAKQRAIPTQIGLSLHEMFFIDVLLQKNMAGQSGGKLRKHPVREGYWYFAREDVASIEVIERSAEAIVGSAKDNRDFLESAAAGMAGQLMGTSVKEKIVPYVAYMVVTSEFRGPEGELIEREQAIFAIPSEIESEDFAALGVTDDESGRQLVEDALKNAARKGVDELTDEGKELLRDVVGDGLIDMIDAAADIQGDLDMVANFGVAKIGSTDGTRGRVMARLVAEKLRAWSGLDHVRVSRIDA